MCVYSYLLLLVLKRKKLQGFATMWDLQILELQSFTVLRGCKHRRAQAWKEDFNLQANLNLTVLSREEMRVFKTERGKKGHEPLAILAKDTKQESGAMYVTTTGHLQNLQSSGLSKSLLFVKSTHYVFRQLYEVLSFILA